MTKKQKPNKTWKLGELVRLQRKEKKNNGIEKKKFNIQSFKTTR